MPITVSIGPMRRSPLGRGQSGASVTSNLGNLIAMQGYRLPARGQQTALAARYGATGLSGPMGGVTGAGISEAPPDAGLYPNEATLRAIGRSRTARGARLSQAFAQQDAAQQRQMVNNAAAYIEMKMQQAIDSSNWDEVTRLKNMRVVWRRPGMYGPTYEGDSGISVEPVKGGYRVRRPE